MSLTRYAAEKSTHKEDRESVKQDIDVTMSIVGESQQTDFDFVYIK